MALRKAIGAVKDQTSISIAKVAANASPELEILVVKATSHDEDPADEKYYREIISLISSSRGYVNACVATISKRIRKTRDWIVALKALMLIHRVLIDGHPSFEEEILYATRRGIRVLNMSGFRDEAHSNSWDHTGFVRFYAMYLDEKVEFAVFERRVREDERKFDEGDDESGRRENRDDFEYGMPKRSRSYGELNGDMSKREKKKEITPIKEMKPERLLGILDQQLRILDRVLACRPTGMAKNDRLVLVSLYQMVKESSGLYIEICEALGVLLDRFTEMEYAYCLKGFDIYAGAAKIIDDLVMFYGWCKDMGIGSSSEYPEVNKITENLLGTLGEFLQEMTNRRTKSSERSMGENVPAKQEQEPEMNEVKALPPPESYTPPPLPELQPKPQHQHVTEDFINLKDNGISADEQGNELALALFSGPPTTNTNGAWVAFSSDGEPEVTSAWQTPSAQSGQADWELTLVESASNLSKQKATSGGGFDQFLLNGMYDQGLVRQHVSTRQLTGGSASSVALPGVDKSATKVLALLAPDGTIQPVGNQDPFAASIAVPPPSYVQIADMERKHHLLASEQKLWQHYGRDGMHGQASLAKISGASGFYGPTTHPLMMPSGMPHVNGMGHQGGFYYYPSY
ncbi:clathrin assembly protein [Salix suchowensis]|nr:clathrin assembly protein [Salix suchowensis]